MVNRTENQSTFSIDDQNRLPQLDGLRGVFVALVVVFHAGISWAGGFYSAVDGFFVLSGFLITSLLVKDISQFGRVKFETFWIKRARRLLPALFMLVLVVAIGEALFGDPALLPTVRGDCLAALFYVSNWYYISTHVGYFGLSVVKSPLQHTWTLAIEEQFYIFWPILIAILYKALKKFHLMAIITLIFSLISAVLMVVVYNNGSDLNGAYYGTETRAEALFLGCTLGLISVNIGRLPEWFMRFIRMTGPAAAFGALIISVFAGGPAKWMFFGGFYLFDVCIAITLAYVIFFPHTVFANLFSVKPLTFLGMISYGLYLWQYPVVQVVNQARTGFSGWFLFAIQTIIAVLLAISSYYLLEKPVRIGSFFKKAKSLIVAGPFMAAVVVIAVIIGTLTPAAKSFAIASNNIKVQAILLKSHPIRALLVGDSLAVTAGFGLATVDKQYGVQLYDQGLVGCGTLIHGLIRADVNMPADNQVGIGANCSLWPQTYANDVKKFNPDVAILMAGRWEVYDRNWGNGWEYAGEPYFDNRLATSLEKAVAVLGVNKIPVIICTTPYFNTLNPVTGALEDSSNPSRVNAYNAVVNSVAAKYPGHVFVYNLNKIIDPAGHYSEYIDGTEIRWTDGIHITEPQGGEFIAQTLLPLAVNVGLKYRQSK